MLLHEKLKAPYRLLLASQSPRRRELIAGCGLPYELAPKYDCEEPYPADMAAEEVPGYLSQLKSKVYPAALAERDILLTADTVVVLNGEVLGKPRDREDAVEMLFRLSGRRHTVVSGVTFRTAERMHSFDARTNVWFRVLDDDEIDTTSTRSAPSTRPGRTAFRSGSDTPPSSVSKAPSTTSWDSPFQKVYTELNQFLDR